MKPQISSQGTETHAPVLSPAQFGTAASSRKPARRVRPSIGDLHERITARAYALYVQRGQREGCALEDWVDAEREILSRNVSSQALVKPHRDMES